MATVPMRFLVLAFPDGNISDEIAPELADLVDKKTVVYAHTKGWSTVIPIEAWAGGIAASVIIGAVAGLIPALRAARLSPTQALWSV